MKLNMDLSKITIPEEPIEESTKKRPLATTRYKSTRNSMFTGDSENGSRLRGGRSKTLANLSMSSQGTAM
jgi:hypothetical protein